MLVELYAYGSAVCWKLWAGTDTVGHCLWRELSCWCGEANYRVSAQCMDSDLEITLLCHCSTTCIDILMIFYNGVYFLNSGAMFYNLEDSSYMHETFKGYSTARK